MLRLSKTLRSNLTKILTFASPYFNSLRKNYWHIIIITLHLICLLGVSVTAQKTADELIGKLYQIWENHYHNHSADLISGDAKAVEVLFEFNNDTTTNYDNIIYDLKIAEAALYKKHWGVDWNTNYLINSAPGMEMADNIIYRSRIQTEVKWNVLNNGYLENKFKSQIKENEALMYQIQNNQSIHKRKLLPTWHTIIYHFNLQKINLLNTRLEIAKSKLESAYQLYDKGLVLQEEMLKNAEDYAEVKSLLNIYEDYNAQLTGYITPRTNQSYPLIDINYPAIIEAVSAPLNDSVAQLVRSSIELESKRINTINFSVFTRYNYYDLINLNNVDRSFFTFGAAVGVPLNFDQKEKNRVNELKLQSLSQPDPTQQVQLQQDVLSYFYEFRYKFKQFNSFYHKTLYYKELLRKEEARYAIDKLSFNPLKALRLLDDLLAVETELIDIKQQMYLYLLRIYLTLPNSSLNELFTVSAIEDLDMNQKLLTFDEAYIWSKTVLEYSPEFIVAYCKKLNLNAVAVSLPSDDARSLALTSQLREAKISTTLLIGKNQLIHEGIEEYLEGISQKKYRSNIVGIHLDIEPHTFDDWKGNEAMYLSKYLIMLQSAQKIAINNGWSISVSLPLYYPSDVMNEIFSSVDQVYFMCYENVKSDYLLRKMEPYPAEKIVVALRTEDFQSVDQINEKIREIELKRVFGGYIIHDLGRLIQIDK
jgi:hypothetical protein